MKGVENRDFWPVTEANAEQYVLAHGGSQDLATQFKAYVVAMEQAPPDHGFGVPRPPWQGYSTEFQNNVESLWESMGLSDHQTVQQLGEYFAQRG